MEIFEIKKYEWGVSVHVNTAPNADKIKQQTALLRYAYRCAEKANFCHGSCNVGVGSISVRIYSRKDLRRLEHFLQMLNSKRSEKVYFSSLGR